MKELLQAGLHFGHQTRKWDPRMERYLAGERNGIYLIDLKQTLFGVEKAYVFVRDLVAVGGNILFVGTKKQVQDAMKEEAGQCGMPYINERWLGGLLTNFATISSRVSKLTEYENSKSAGEFEGMPKKEALQISREMEKLRKNLGGIKGLKKLPDAIFIIDTVKEHLAITEARKLKIPVVAVVDTNCNPDVVDFPIPGNDDAIRASRLMCRVISEAAKEGRYINSRTVLSYSQVSDVADENVEDASNDTTDRLSQPQVENNEEVVIDIGENFQGIDPPKDGTDGTIPDTNLGQVGEVNEVELVDESEGA